MTLRTIVSCAALAAIASAPALSAPSSMLGSMLGSNASRSVTMKGQNGSHQNGQAWVKNVAGGISVRVSISNEPRGAIEPAHIHAGTCSRLNPVPWKALNNVVNGVSNTTLRGVQVSGLRPGRYAINVHQSASNLKHYVSCGNL